MKTDSGKCKKADQWQNQSNTSVNYVPKTSCTTQHKQLKSRAAAAEDLAVRWILNESEFKATHPVLYLDQWLSTNAKQNILLANARISGYVLGIKK